MKKATPQCRVRQCSKCPENSVYFCLRMCCRLDLCLYCKKSHFTDPITKDHQVVIYRNTCALLRNNYARSKHPKKYCTICGLPVMNNCITDETHETMDIKEAYKAKQFDLFIDCIKLQFKALFLEKKKTQYEASLRNRPISNSIIMDRAITLESFIDEACCWYANLIVKKSYTQFVQTNRDIGRMLMYEQTYVQTDISPIQVILFLKKKRFDKIFDGPYFRKHQQVIITELINKMDVIMLLRGIKMEKKKIDEMTWTSSCHIYVCICVLMLTLCIVVYIFPLSHHTWCG